MPDNIPNPSIPNWVKLLNQYDAKQYPSGKLITAEEWNALFLAEVAQGNYHANTLDLLINEYLPTQWKNIAKDIADINTNVTADITDFKNKTNAAIDTIAAVANAANSIANTAKTNSENAVQIASTADATSQQAKDIATEANTTAESAKQTAENISAIATEAKDIATEANTTAVASKNMVDALQTTLDTDYYTKADTDKLFSDLIGGAPEEFDTLKEISDWIANDESGTAALINRVGALETDMSTANSSITNLQNNKVDKITGKSLSTNDFTDAYKLNVDGNTTARHTHANKTLLDTYTQTETNLADAVTKKHSHSNKEVLDNITASYTNEEKIKLAGLKNYDDTEIQTDITALQNGKVDKENGKGLSTNDFTTVEKTKLSGIETGAEKNIQSNWLQTDATADDYIKNKPSIPEGITLYNTTGQNTDGAMTQKAVTDTFLDYVPKTGNSTITGKTTFTNGTSEPVRINSTDTGIGVGLGETGVTMQTDGSMVTHPAINIYTDAETHTTIKYPVHKGGTFALQEDVPAATTLYDTTGQNTDGAMTQKATTDTLDLCIAEFTGFTVPQSKTISSDVGDAALKNASAYFVITTTSSTGTTNKLRLKLYQRYTLSDGCMGGFYCPEGHASPTVTFVKSKNASSYVATLQGAEVFYVKDTLQIADYPLSSDISTTDLISKLLTGAINFGDKIVDKELVEGYGYIRYASGLILQWGGNAVDANTSVVVNFFRPFAATWAYRVFVQDTSHWNANDWQGLERAEHISGSQFKQYNGYDSTTNFDWFAIGLVG